MRGGRQPWPRDTEAASGSRSRGSMRQDAPCTRRSQRHRPAHPDPGFQPPQGTRPVSVLLQPQVPGAPSTHVWAPPPAHSCHGEELPLDSLLLTPTPPLLCHPHTGPRILQLVPALRRARAPRLPLQPRLWSHPLARSPHWGAPQAGVLLSLAQCRHPCPRHLEPTDWGPHLRSRPACS